MSTGRPKNGSTKRSITPTKSAGNTNRAPRIDLYDVSDCVEVGAVDSGGAYGLTIELVRPFTSSDAGSDAAVR